MPVFGTGHARLRFATAAEAMVRSALETPSGVEHLVFVTNDEENVATLRPILESAAGNPIEVERSRDIEPDGDTFWSDAYSLDMN